MVPVDGCRIDDEAFAANTGGTMPLPLTSVNAGGLAPPVRCFAGPDGQRTFAP